MPPESIDRRQFLSTTVTTGAAVCGLCLGAGLPALASDEEKKKEPIDPKQLNFCGYTCPKDCKFLKGTLEDDVELKKAAFKLWKLEERFGIEFDPETAICYGCKTMDKPEGEVLARCDVRVCAQEKKLDCCIECAELTECEKTLWSRFPSFKLQVMKMREDYLAQSG